MLNSQIQSGRPPPRPGPCPAETFSGKLQLAPHGAPPFSGATRHHSRFPVTKAMKGTF